MLETAVSTPNSNMDPQHITSTFQDSMAAAIRLEPDGDGRWLVSHPFCFDDGDHYVIIVRTDGPRNWWLTDEGNTYLHLSIRYDLAALKSGTCGEQLAAALDRQGVADRRGSLVLPLEDGAELGRAVCEFAQCLIQIDALAGFHCPDLGVDVT